MKFSLRLPLVVLAVLLVAVTPHQVSAWIGGPSMQQRRAFLQDAVVTLVTLAAPQRVVAADDDQPAPASGADAAVAKNIQKARDGEQKKKEAEARKMAEDTKKRLAVGRIGLY